MNPASHFPFLHDCPCTLLTTRITRCHPGGQRDGGSASSFLLQYLHFFALLSSTPPTIHDADDVNCRARYNIISGATHHPTPKSTVNMLYAVSSSMHGLPTPTMDG